MLKNFIKLFILVIIVSAFFAIPAQAKKTLNEWSGVLQQTMGPTGYNTLTNMPQTVPELAGFWIKTALSVVGIVFFIFMFYAGFLWMTARGAEETIKKAQSTIIMAVIGLLIIVSGYAITDFMVKYLVEGQTADTGTQTQDLNKGPLGCCVDWVSSGKKYSDTWKDEWGSGGASQFDSQRACRVTTEDDCQFQGESTTAYDKLGCPGPANGCWEWHEDGGKFGEISEETNKQCTWVYCQARFGEE